MLLPLMKKSLMGGIGAEAKTSLFCVVPQGQNYFRRGRKMILPLMEIIPPPLKI
jgi:hypothetical protein